LVPEAGADPSQLGFTMSIDLDPDVGQASPTNTQDGPFQFAGNVTVVKLPTSLQRVTVTLSAEMNTGWEVIVSPDTLVITQSDRPSPFYATVVVPAATPVGSGKLTVSGSGTDGFQTETATAEATVVVKQYFDLLFYGTWSPEKVRPGDWINGELNIVNRGNGRDTVWVDITDAHKSVWDYEVEEAVIVSPGQTETVEFTLYTEEGYKPEGTGNLSVTFAAVSRTATSQGLNYTRTFTVTFSYLSLKERLAEDWPVYAGLGVGIAAVAILCYLGLKWWRARREGKGPRGRPVRRLLRRVSSRLGRKA
jgi:hypothetical protein